MYYSFLTHDKMMIVLILLTCSPSTFGSNYYINKDASNYKYEEDEYHKHYTSACSGELFCQDPTIIHPHEAKEGYYKCACDAKCSAYGDCCPDAQGANNPPAEESVTSKTFSCFEELKIYGVRTCPSSFTDTVIKMKCENISEGVAYEDVAVMTPVVDTLSQVTYLNAYCANCNEVFDYEEFELAWKCWALSVEGTQCRRKFIPPSLVLPNVKFDPHEKAFTATALNGTYYRCHHKVNIPKRLRPHLRQCLPGLISSCPKKFNEIEVEKKCRSSMYVVYSDIIRGEGEFYKNEYCARCNGVQSPKHCQFAHYWSPGAEDDPSDDEEETVIDLKNLELAQ